MASSAAATADLLQRITATQESEETERDCSQVKGKFAFLTTDQLDQLLALAQGRSNIASSILSQANSSPSSVISTACRAPDSFDNTKYEALACTGLKPRYDSSPKDLPPI